MTMIGRTFVRVGGAVFGLLFIAAIFVFLSADLLWLRWVGVFMGLMLVDRIVHRREGDVPIPELLTRGRVNTARALAPGVYAVLIRAYEGSIVKKTVLSMEIARELSGKKEIREGLTRLDLDAKDFIAKIEDLLGREEAHTEEGRVERIAFLEKLLGQAFRIAAQNGHRFIQLTDVFSSLPLSDGGLINRIFAMFNIEPGDLERALIFAAVSHHKDVFGRLPGEISGIVLPASRGVRHRVMNRAWTARPTPTLDRFGMDYTDAAREQAVGFLIGHEKEYEHMVTVLARESNPNAILSGEEGSGKETLIAHLAFQIEKDEVPPALFDKRLVSLDVARLVAGSAPEELQARLQVIVAEINLAGNIILLVPDIHNLVKTAGAGFISAADALLPVIRDNSFPILGTTFPREYRELIEPRSAFAGMFEVVDVGEISPEDAERILVYQALILETQTKATITFGAIKTAVSLAKKYFKNLLLPGSAVALLKSAVTGALGRGEKVINHESVIKAAEARVNVPLHESTAEESAKLLHLEDAIHARLIDQEEAVKAVADSLRQYRSGLARQGGPIASFLFVGPTGVGKTELAKILADIQFSSESAMMRFDMSEYKEKESIGRFIGVPNGSSDGTLTEALKKQPYGLVLLDEFEKASPDILDLFLQVLDDGRLTDSSGHTVSFENTIIIATSNAHSDIINETLNKGESMSSIADYLKTRLTDVFKPELINRFTRIVIFHDLRMEDMLKISALELNKMAKTMADKGQTLSFGAGVLEQIAKWGYDPAFGARPLKRAVDEHLRSPLASWILEQKPPRGAEIKVELSGEILNFSVNNPT